MDFSFTDQQNARRARIVEFARGELEDAVRRNDRTGEFPLDNWRRCGEEGIIGAHVPRQYGGGGLDAATTVVIHEALGYGCRDNGLTLAIGGQTWSVQEPIVVYGSEEQKERFLPGLCTGELIGAHGVTEETSGSDALSLQTTAVKADGGYLLNGKKSFIGMAPAADLALVLASTEPESGRWGVSAFIVPADSDGFSQGPPRPKTGTRANPLGDLLLDDCFVPEELRLGDEGLGMSLFTRTISWERAFILAGQLGSMQALLERCVGFARERRQFGRPIGAFQSVSNRIADMRLRLETSRLLVYQAARMKDEGLDASLECSMAKLHVSESLLACAADAVRIHGARGYLEEFEIERELRDALGGVIYAGTSDIQRNLIAGLLGL